ANEIAIRVVVGRVDLDRLQAAGPLEGRVRLPALDVGSPGDQGVLVPEADGLAVPARHVGAQARHGAFHVEFATDVDVDDEVARHAGQELDHLGRDHHVVVPQGGFVPAAHVAFRPAIL